MSSFLKLLSLTFFMGVWGSVASAGCNPQLEVCDFPSSEEIIARSTLVPNVRTQRRFLGTQWSKTHERLIESIGRIDYSCVEAVVQTDRGNFNAALCMPAWMRGVPPTATLIFQRIATRTRTVMYLVSMDDIYLYRWYRYR